MRECLFALGLELFGRAEAVVRAPFLNEHTRARLIFSEPLRRSVRPNGAANFRPLIPVEAKPTEILEDRRIRFDRGSIDVGIFDAKNERAFLPSREQPVEERCADVSDVKVACWARCEADAHLALGSGL